MKLLRSLKAALAASVCLLPLQAVAQGSDSFEIGDKPAEAAPAPVKNNWISIGGQYQSQGSYYFGRYTGATHPGFYGLGDFHLGGRDPWDSGGTHYWELLGNNLGYDDRSASLKVGQQGTWGLTVYYDGIPYFATDSFLTVWDRSGNLAAGVAPGSAHSTASVSSRLWNTPLSTRRDIFGGTGRYQWRGWTFSTAFKHDHKEGMQANSLAILAAPAATATTLTAAGLGYFAQPIDWDIDRYDATAAYGNERFQAQVGYTYSQFTDNVPVFHALNPFAFPSAATLGPSGSSPARVSSFYTAPPSNSEHQVKVLLGYNFSPTMRLNANFAYGLQMQNAGYQPFNGNGNANLNAYSVPRSSFDGLVQTVFGNVAFTAQPLPKMDIRLAYTIDDRANQSPRNRYVFSAVDNATVTTPSSGYYNLPYSYNHQSATAEVGYRLLPQTKVSVGYQFDDTYRTYADASVVIENTAWARIRSQVMPDVFAALRYAHSDREAHNYDRNANWRYLCGGAQCESEPAGLVMYYLASRTRDEVKGTLDWSPTHAITTSMMVRFANDNYGDSTYGMRSNYNLSLGPDVTYQVSKGLVAHAYYTFQQIYYNQNSLYASAGTGTGPTGTGYRAPWNLKTTDQTHTVGVTVDWQAIPEVLKFTADYNLSYGNTNYALGDGGYLVGGRVSATTLANLAVQPLPDVTALLNAISIRGEYSFRPNMTLMFGYAYERFSYADYAYGAGSTQYVNAFLPGTYKPNYAIHVVGAGLRYRF